MTPADDERELSSLVDEALREKSEYEDAVVQADTNPERMERVLPALKRWGDRRDRIFALRLSMKSEPSEELRTKIKKWADWNETSSARISLVVQGQVAQANANSAEAQVRAKRTLETAEHMTEYARKWLSDRKLTKESLNEVRTAEFNRAMKSEFERFLENRTEEGSNPPKEQPPLQ